MLLIIFHRQVPSLFRADIDLPSMYWNRWRFPFVYLSLFAYTKQIPEEDPDSGSTCRREDEGIGARKVLQACDEAQRSSYCYRGIGTEDSCNHPPSVDEHGTL